MRNDRRPRIGDYLLVSHKGFAPELPPPARGIVVEIETNSLGHQEKVFVTWQTKPPAGYNSKYGFAGANIYNLRNNFRVFRDGKEIK